MKKVVILLIAILLIPTTLAEQFPVQNSNYGFVGWVQEDSPTIGDYRISYPATSDGKNADMAQNGPFAIVVFYPDEGESVDQYAWLQEGLSRWGYITLVVSSSWESIENQLIDWNQNPSQDFLGSQGMFALNHISLSGHGTGAYEAAEIVKSGDYGIDGLFALGLEGSSTSTTNNVLLSNPSSALFLTGTTDEIAPANENVMNYVDDWFGAWQIMHVRGANHLGYQESDTFWERFADGDSTMGREGQQEHALNHILPYLNLSLRGDDDAYQAAFNREDKSVSSDPDSYIDEDLNRSRLYDMNNISSSNLSLMLDQEISITADVTMRDGSVAFGNVSCILPEHGVVQGTLQNGVASCTINGSMLMPGESLIEIRVADNSFSDWLEIFVVRIGTPMQITNPLPGVNLNQHSFVVITPDLFASDPDGEELVFAEAYFTNDNESVLAIDNTFTELNISHQNISEWEGTIEMHILLVAGDEMANLSINVTLLPVDDQVVQDTIIPQQQVMEDGQSIVVDISVYVSDPENQPLVITASRDYPGLRINTSLTTVLIDPQTHWNGAELVELIVSDGTTDPISVIIPVSVTPVDDTVEFSDTSLEIEMDEDSVLILDLQNYTIDVDDDDLTYAISGASEIVGFSLAGSELVIAGNPDLFGISQFEINVTDGSNYSSMTLIVDTKPVPDLPTVGISSVSVEGESISVLWTISDQDGDVGLIKSVIFAGESIEFETECSGETLLTCITQYRLKNMEVGTYNLEVKVWDNVAQEWSNNASQEVEITSTVVAQDDAESSNDIADWILPIGLVVIGLLLVGYFFSKRK